MPSFFDGKYLLVIRTLPLLASLLLAKGLLWSFGIHPLPISTLTSSLIAATVFLMGFLISGALPDYKEAEKIPGEISASLDAIGEEYEILRHTGAPPAIVDAARAHLATTATMAHQWFHREQRTKAMLGAIDQFGMHFAALLPATQANFIVRLKQEQQTIRRAIIRADTIRDTSFSTRGRVVVRTMILLICSILLFGDLGSLFASLLFTGASSFLLLAVEALAHDLDDPFHDSHGAGTDTIGTNALHVVAEKYHVRESMPKKTSRTAP
ncbi:hypothetical protein KBD18_02180 [Patescibacteria group bacterium]|nr:hypothetical protein [Patescibacteria group bacterium]